MAHFDVIRNLPHAATIARRIETRLVALRVSEAGDAEALFVAVAELNDALADFEDAADPPEAEGDRAAAEAAEIARRLVDAIESLGVGDDRLGQAVRNLFECLGLGPEGAEISLRAGEDPSSLLRPL